MTHPGFLDVACAIISDAGGRILCAQRGEGMIHAGQWEFPGGKIEPGESPQTCIQREIREELGLMIQVESIGPVFASHHTSGKILRLYTHICKVSTGEPKALEHAEVRWLKLEEMNKLNWQVADLPILDWVFR